MLGRALLFFSAVCVSANALSFPEAESRVFWSQYSSVLGPKSLADAFQQLKQCSWLDPVRLSETDVLVALSLVESGRDLLGKFLPLYHSRKVTFRSLRSPEGLKAGLDPATSSGAYSNGVIYLDEKASVLEYLAVLVHEATHAVEWLGSEEGKKESDELKRQAVGDLAHAHALLVRSEHRAFRAQDRFQADLSKQEPDFRKALEFLVRRGKMFPFPMTQSFFSSMMVSGYAIPQAAVDAYFEKHSY
jgi:hypothetical protein